jgi:hypothetical protein
LVLLAALDSFVFYAVFVCPFSFGPAAPVGQLMAAIPQASPGNIANEAPDFLLLAACLANVEVAP